MNLERSGELPSGGRWKLAAEPTHVRQSSWGVLGPENDGENLRQAFLRISTSGGKTRFQDFQAIEIA